MSEMSVLRAVFAKHPEVKIATPEMMGYNIEGCVIDDATDELVPGIISGLFKDEHGNYVMDAEGEIQNAAFERAMAAGEVDPVDELEDCGDIIMVNWKHKVVVTTTEKYKRRWEHNGFEEYSPIEHGFVPTKVTKQYIIQQLREAFNDDDRDD